MAGVKIGSCAVAAVAIVASLALAACAADRPDGAGSGGAISDQATIRDHDGHVLRAGTNGWTCMPESEKADRRDPWCLYGPWDEFMAAHTAGSDPEHVTIGVAYMRAGDPHVTNIDPSRVRFKVPADWRAGVGDYLMARDPEGRSTEFYSTDPSNGGAWLMWAGTPFEHVMIPANGSQ